MSLLQTLGYIVGHPLNKGRPSRALVGFAYWQIKSRLRRGPFVVEWISPAKLYVRSGEAGLTGNIYCGLHEFRDMAYLLHVLGPGDCFVDVGANAGAYTVLACAVRGARGYSFEPVPGTFERLKANIELNNLTAIVDARNIGLSDHPSTLKFTTGEDCTNHVIGPGEVTAEAVSVPVETLDASLAGTCPTLIKIDVEGFETPVLNGAEKTLDCPTLHSIVMELNGSGARYGYDDTALAALLREKGFVTYEYDPFERQLTDTQGRLPQSGNALFVRDLALVQAKLQKTPRINVHGFDL